MKAKKQSKGVARGSLRGLVKRRSVTIPQPGGGYLHIDRYLVPIRHAIQQTRDDHAEIIAALPNRAKTPGQRALQKKHGTPRAFARAVVNAIGEISVLEANEAIIKYHDEWDAAL